MKKWLIGLLAAVLLLGGCSPRQAPSQPGQNRLITVGFSQAGAESDCLSMLEDCADDAVRYCVSCIALSR